MTNEDRIELADMAAWADFAEANREALEMEYGSVETALLHATKGGLTLGGGACPLTRVYFAH